MSGGCGQLQPILYLTWGYLIESGGWGEGGVVSISTVELGKCIQWGVSRPPSPPRHQNVIDCVWSKDLTNQSGINGGAEL